MQTDAELVQTVLGGQQDAYAELVRRHERSVLAVAGRILGDVHAAQDAVQETFVAAYSGLGSLRAPAAFGAWVVQIGRNQARTMLRRRVQTVALDETVEPASESPNGHIREETQLVLSAVMDLPEKQRQAILLRYFRGHALEEIAEITNQALGTVKSNLSRAMARLRRRLERSQ